MPQNVASQPIRASSHRLKLMVVRPTLATGGADRVTVTLLENLDRGLFETTLVLMRSEGKLLGRVPSDVRLLTLRARSLWRAWLPLAKLLRSEKPDIFFSTSSGMNVAAALAHRLARSTSRMVLSERGLLRLELGSKKRLLALAKRLLYRRADCVTGVSREVVRELRDRIGVPAEKIRLIHNPIVDSSLRGLASARLDHPWFQESIPIVLSVGRLVPEKDFPTLIEAFSQVRSHRAVRLVVLGDGPLRSRLTERVARMGLASDIDFAGFDPNPFRYMSRCSIFVLSSQSEGLPGVLIQAMACGAAVVSTDCSSGPREIISPGETGVLVRVADPSALAQAIESLLEDSQERARLGRNAMEGVRRFRVETTLPHYQSALLGETWTPANR